MKTPVKIIFLDDNEDLRTLMELLLKMNLDADCATYSRLSELQHGSQPLAADVAILDINLGPGEPTGIDAFQWLKACGFNGKILFLTGHALSDPLVLEAAKSGTEVLEKPVKMDELYSIIRNAVDSKTGGTGLYPGSDEGRGPSQRVVKLEGSPCGMREGNDSL